METSLVRIQQVESQTMEIRQAARLIRQGDLVAFPTETVYGLGGNGLREDAVHRIYEAKGRPSDNPLILHVSDMDMVGRIAREIPKTARKAMETFWPGPMTVILPKTDQVLPCVTGGLDSVAIRMPNHPVALALIREAGVPIAAPSANLSGRPSPTTAQHVMEDLQGRIPMILDGGSVRVGVESTIVDFTQDVPVILRPGYITKEKMEEALGCSCLMNASLTTAKEDVPKAPGMKYRHYAPQASMTLVLGGDLDQVVERINELTKEKHQNHLLVGVLCTDETKDRYEGDCILSVGRRSKMETVVSNLYRVLREFDHQQVDVIFSEGFEGEILEEAVMNRLVKAAGGNILRI